MSTETPKVPVTTTARWIGYVLSAPPVALLLFSAGMKLMGPPSVLDGFRQLGYPEHLALIIGAVELACTLVYLVPRTACLGAILLTGYLGGAVATHVRVGEIAFIAPVILGILIWGGLFMRDPRVRALIPLQR